MRQRTASGSASNEERIGSGRQGLDLQQPHKVEAEHVVEVEQPCAALTVGQLGGARDIVRDGQRFRSGQVIRHGIGESRGRAPSAPQQVDRGVAGSCGAALTRKRCAVSSDRPPALQPDAQGPSTHIALPGGMAVLGWAVIRGTDTSISILTGQYEGTSLRAPGNPSCQALRPSARRVRGAGAECHRWCCLTSIPVEAPVPASAPAPPSARMCVCVLPG